MPWIFWGSGVVTRVMSVWANVCGSKLWPFFWDRSQPEGHPATCRLESAPRLWGCALSLWFGSQPILPGRRLKDGPPHTGGGAHCWALNHTCWIMRSFLCRFACKAFQVIRSISSPKNALRVNLIHICPDIVQTCFKHPPKIFRRSSFFIPRNSKTSIQPSSNLVVPCCTLLYLVVSLVGPGLLRHGSSELPLSASWLRGRLGGLHKWPEFSGGAGGHGRHDAVGVASPSGLGLE